MNIIEKQRLAIKEHVKTELLNLNRLSKVFHKLYEDPSIEKTPRNRLQKIELVEKAVHSASSKFTSTDVWNAVNIAHPEVNISKSLVLSNIYRLARNKEVKILDKRARKDGYLYATVKSN